MKPTLVELLAPARDLACGRAAIECGADAVYIGAPAFGAREKAGNSLDDIARLTEYAHQYWARVYVTLNTLLRDDEIGPACKLAADVCEAGADALIVQDAGLLEAGLPPIPLIASTQMHNNTPEKVAFLEKVGFHRVILARELDLDEVRAIRHAAPTIELEFFVHGALCVSYSGQCRLSYALGGRSGNRGQCAQPCRKRYSLVDARGHTIAGPKHLLSLRDLNLSGHLAELLDAGVTSFKIEGRLKDEVYVANVTAWYRVRLDEAFAANPCARWRRASSGQSTPGFTPDLNKTFNRGYTAYFLNGRKERMGALDTPKMTGPEVGRVRQKQLDGFAIDGGDGLRPGDGICFFDAAGELRGSAVNGVRGTTVLLDKPEGLKPGMIVYRNHDHEFEAAVKKRRATRRIGVALLLCETGDGLMLRATDEDGNEAAASIECLLPAARKSEAALDRMRAQLEKTGQTEFACVSVEIEARPCVVPVSLLNALRRDALDGLRAARAGQRPRMMGGIIENDAPYPERELSFEGNVLNRFAEKFYHRHGVIRIEPAAESGLDMHGRKVMTTRYCIRLELGMCGKNDIAEPLILVDEDGNRLELRFDCARCESTFFLKKKKVAKKNR